MDPSVPRPADSIADNEIESRTLQVAGLRDFEERRWRECLLYYLFGVWSEQSSVTTRPKINFGEITLCLDLGTKEYFAYGAPVEMECPKFADQEVLTVGYGQQEVEQSLIRFVKSDRIKALVIRLRQGEVSFWKKSKRSHLGITGKSIPPTIMDVL